MASASEIGKEPAVAAAGSQGPRGERPPSRRNPPRLSGRNSYSFFVSCMKLLLPALAAGLALLVIMWPQIRPLDDRFRITVSDLSIDQAESLSMVNARFDGLDERDQPFMLTADIASQVPGEKDLIHLELPKGDISLSDGTWLAVTAKTGRFDRADEVLDLFGDVVLFHDDGYEMHTQEARIYVDDGQAEGSKPVEGQGPGGFLTAEGFRITDRGDRVLFTGRSSLIAFTDALEEGQQP